MLAQLRALGPLRLGAIAGVGLGVLGFLLWLVLRAGQPAMAPLYSDLEARDAAAIVAVLERARIPHRLGAGGAQVLVAESEVPRARLLLARDGLPSGGGVGWEIFDRSESLTTTPFQQDINRIRALEGELARTIRGLSGVRTARVHLVLPRREPFQRERPEAQASVVLSMVGSQRLDREAVQSVLHLVATAVPGLRPQNISIVDSRGELLARGGQPTGTGAAAAATGEELRRAHEARISRAVEEMLERTLGPGRVRAEAAVEMDFDRVQTTEERFDPDNQVPRSTQSAQESNRSGETPPVTVANQLPGAQQQQQGGQQTQETRQEETTNFEIGRTVRNVVREHPQVRRISVAVLVDGVREAQAGGAPAFRERTPEELARIATLVRSAVGFDERRGDRVEVVSMRFTDPDAGEAQEQGLQALLLAPNTLLRLGETLIIALVGLAAILMVGRPLATRLVAGMAPRTALASGGAAGAGGAALPGQPGQPALPGQPGHQALPGPQEGETMVSLAMVEGQMRASSIARVQQLVDKHPEETLQVVRRWLAPEDAA
ncbi:MAG: flagellar basal-body MS-ring/collar protein FliF [Acetobacteraceae bacterium]